MKTKGLLLLSVAAALSLSGCAAVDAEVTARAKEAIFATDEYKEYRKLSDEGMLDENGVYIKAAAVEEQGGDDLNGSIPVTFAKNNFLICVYSQEEGGKPIAEEMPVGMQPGGSLYSVGVTENKDKVKSRLYSFSKFRIWEYDADGERRLYSEVNARSGLLLKIPEDYEGNGFSIEPLGEYAPCRVTGSDYYLDASGAQKPLNGEWTLNGKAFSDGTGTYVSPVSRYTVAYDYSRYADSYYFVSSEPTCWYSDEEKQTVTFHEMSASDEDMQFAVQLHRYITLNIKNTLANPFSKNPALISADRVSAESIESLDIEQNEKSLDISKLKAGDTLIIRVSESSKIVGSNISVPSPVQIAEGFEYTLTIPDTSAALSVTVSKRNADNDSAYEELSIANAAVTLTRADGSEVKSGDERPAEDEKVTLTVTPHEGYYIDGKNVKDSVYSKKLKYAEVEKVLSDMERDGRVKAYIRLRLDSAAEYGECEYSLDGEAVETPDVKVREGQTLKLKFTANERYSIVNESWLASLRFLNDEKEVSEKLKITPEMDGTTVKLDSFGIKVEEVK